MAVTNSRMLPDLPNRPGTNWIEKKGGHLPPLVKRVVKHLVAERGYTQERAIPTAINWCKKMCATGTAFGGKVHVSGVAQGAACAAVAQWEALKARESIVLESAFVPSWSDLHSLADSAHERLGLLEDSMGEDHLATLVLQEGGTEDTLGQLALIELTIAEGYPRTRLGRTREGKFQNLLKKLSEGGAIECPNCGKQKSKDGECLYCSGKIEEAGFFDASKHPRGKPKNRGQFAPKGGAQGTAQSSAGSSAKVATATTQSGATVNRRNSQTVAGAQRQLKRAKQDGSNDKAVQAARARLGAEVAQREQRIARKNTPPGLKLGDPDPRHPQDHEAWNQQPDGQRQRNMGSFIDAGGELPNGHKFSEGGKLLTRKDNPEAFPGHGGKKGHPDDPKAPGPNSDKSNTSRLPTKLRNRRNNVRRGVLGGGRTPA